MRMPALLASGRATARRWDAERFEQKDKRRRGGYELAALPGHISNHVPRSGSGISAGSRASSASTQLALIRRAGIECISHALPSSPAKRAAPRCSMSQATSASAGMPPTGEGVEGPFRSTEERFDLAPVCFIKLGLLLLRQPHQ